MSHAKGLSKDEVEAIGSYETPPFLRKGCFFLIGIGFFIFAVGLLFDAQRVWVSFLHNHFYFMSLSLGGLFFTALQWISVARWSAPLRRLSEAVASTFPLFLVSFIILIFGLSKLYLWIEPMHIQGDLLLEKKSGYLNFGFFLLRNLFVLLVMLGFGRFFLGNSLLQDKEPKNAVALFLLNKAVTPFFLILFALFYTMQSFDQIMSLEPKWVSTIFGVYCFAGLFYSILALITILAVFLIKKGKLQGVVNENHLHDLGKYLFAFTVFWAYIAFSQFMLIWYANLPEEISYYETRWQGSWKIVSCLLLLKFIVPFTILLPRHCKRSGKVLMGVSIFMLIAQWVDMLWLIQPVFFDGPLVSWIEVGVFAGFLGAFGRMLLHFLQKHPVVAVHDPFLEEALLHHQ